MLLAPAALSLYLIAAACGGGDDAATVSATPAASASATATVSPASSAGSDTPTTSALGDRVVESIDTGYTAEHGGISGGIVLHNRNTSEAVAIPYSVEATIAGVTQTVASATIVLLPGQTLGDGFNGNYTPPDATISKLQINVNLPNARWLASSLVGYFGVTVASTEPQFVHGSVANPFDNASGPFWLSVLAYDSTGRIIGGNDTGVDSIPAHGTANFDAIVPYVQGGTNTARTETYVSFQNDFPDWMKTP